MSDLHPDTGYQMYLQRKAAEKRQRRRAALKGWRTRREKGAKKS